MSRHTDNSLVRGASSSTQTFTEDIAGFRQSVKAPKCVADLRHALSQIQCSSFLPKQRNGLLKEVVMHCASALAIGRPLGTVVILLMGHSGSGKSRTVNKLLGKELLETGRHASTTKEVQRVSMPAVRKDVELDLAFDDTPGTEDTTFADQEQNSVLFHRYCDTFNSTSRKEEARAFMQVVCDLQQDFKHLLSNITPSFRPRSYPNAILVVASWSSIRQDAQNNVNDFTSQVGKSLRLLASSGLYDSERPNVLVVVTHSLSGYDTDCHDMPKEEAGVQWREDALAKETIIQDIAVKIFGPGNAVSVVFVENGSSHKALKRFRELPNGEQTHRNLFRQLKILFERNNGVGCDLQGLHALSALIEGTVISSSRSTVAQSAIGDTLSEDDDDDDDDESYCSSNATFSAMPSTSSEPLLALARMLLGSSYNPLTGKLSAFRSVKASDLLVRFSNDSRFSRVTATGCPTNAAHQLNIPFNPKPLHDSTYQAADARSQSCSAFFAVKEVAVTSLHPSKLCVSTSVHAAIEGLPRWNAANDNIRNLYRAFFHRFGTHFVQSAALGGYVALAASTPSPPLLADITNLMQSGQGTLPNNYKFVGSQCEGGAAESLAVDVLLRMLFDYSKPRPGIERAWILCKDRWMRAVSRDPIFLMNEMSTNYEWIYNASGVSEQERCDLREGARWYLEGEKVVGDKDLTDVSLATHTDSLPRTELRRAVEESIEESINWVSATADRVIKGLVKRLVIAGTIAAVGAALFVMG